MSRLAWLVVSILLLLAAGFLLSLNGCGGGTATFTVPPPASKIQHVVIIFQENRTPDNLFQGLCIAPYGSPSACATNAGPTQFEIQTSNWLNNQVAGGVTQPSLIDLGTNGGAPDNYDLSHAHSAFLYMCDLNTSTNKCAMDGAAKIPTSCNAGATNCAPANPQFQYVNPADVQPYLTMAQTYTFADHMFQTNQGPSFPAHQFIISGTSEPSPGSNMFVAENATGIPFAGMNTGCTSPASEYVYLIDPSGNESTKLQPPCPDHNTLLDVLDTANVSWRYYTPTAGSLWTGPNAIQHICLPQTVGGVLTCTGPDWTGANPKVVLNQTQVLTDITNNQLPQVSWVIPQGLESDHALSNDGSGPAWVASVVNAIGGSAYWSNTAIFIVWDDWGGWYDHVPPPQVVNDGTSWGSGYVYGFRVPMIVISPYAKTAYISKTPHDFGSILKFIENTYNLPSLGFADAHALDDLSDCFNFSQTPTPFQSIAAPLSADYFLNDKRPPTDPDND
jgi:phospholipase C